MFVNLRIFAVFLLPVLLAACAAVPEGPPPPDVALTGKWRPSKAEVSGRDFNLPKEFVLEIQGDRFTTTGGLRPDSGKLVFLRGEPRGLDVIGEEGPTKDMRLPAIYRVLVGGAGLEICYDLSGKARPTEFVSKPDTQLFRISYVRAP